MYPHSSARTGSAVVLCGAAAVGGGYDHLDSHRGPFLVAFAVTTGDKTFAYVCSLLIRVG